MKTSVAVFASHQEAVSSIVSLKGFNFPLSKVSLVSQAELLEDKIQVQSNDRLINAPVIVGTILGIFVGLLTGIGVFAIPGFEFLFNSGAVIGTLGGFELGIALGGLITLILQVTLEREYAVIYDEHIEKGKFTIMVDGSQEEIERARRIIGGDHVEYNVHEHRHAV